MDQMQEFSSSWNHQPTLLITCWNYFSDTDSVLDCSIYLRHMVSCLNLQNFGRVWNLFKILKWKNFNSLCRFPPAINRKIRKKYLNLKFILGFWLAHFFISRQNETNIWLLFFWAKNVNKIPVFSFEPIRNFYLFKKVWEKLRVKKLFKIQISYRNLMFKIFDHQIIEWTLQF